MNNPLTSKGTHPLVILAALAIILVCIVGTAAIMGWIPSSVGGTGASRSLTDAERSMLAPPPPERQPVRASEPRRGDLALAPDTDAESGRAVPAARSRTVAAERERAPARTWCGNCGNVESIRAVKARAEGSGLGAAGGAIVGGLLGNQVGGGSGRQIATVAGAVGGAVAGNQIEGQVKATTSYEIQVRLDDGSMRTFRQDSAPAWRTGQRVRIVDGRLRAP